MFSMELRIARATRSFGEPPGLRNYVNWIMREEVTSAFARISQPVAADRDRMRTSFVFPINPSTPSSMSSVSSSSSGEGEEEIEGRERGVRRYVDVAPRMMPRDRRRRGRGREGKEMDMNWQINSDVDVKTWGF